jgi:hypothetical protein
MIGSIERKRRRLARHSVAPMLLLAVGFSGPVDPTRRAAGYGGVVPIPAPTAPAASSTTRSESPLDQQRRELRAARGRVLYADGRAEQLPATPKPEHKLQCPERRVVQSRTNSAPNS